MDNNQITMWRDDVAEAKTTKTKAVTAERQFIVWFTEAYQSQFGFKYDFKEAKDAGLVKRMLKIFPLDMLKNMTVLMFNDDDSWVCNTDKGISILSTKSNYYARRVNDDRDRKAKGIGSGPRKARF